MVQALTFSRIRLEVEELMREETKPRVALTTIYGVSGSRTKANEKWRASRAGVIASHVVKFMVNANKLVLRRFLRFFFKSLPS